MLTVLIVDDEPIARRRLARMVRGIEGTEVVGEARDGEEALAGVRRLNPDVLLLDVEMPGLDGMSLALGDHALPAVVFVTAHAEHAVEAFAADAVDYLLKPVEPARLEEALDRVRRRRTVDPGILQSLADRLGGMAAPRLAAFRRGSRYFFDATEIDRIRAEAKYAVFVTYGDRYLLEESLASLADRLAVWGFFRVHRSELVNIRFVKALHHEPRRVELELGDGRRVPVARRRLPAVERWLGLS